MNRQAVHARPRVNQPTGFRGTGYSRPSYHYGRSHDYVFFPVGWTDETTGRIYEKGYYDENGQHYANVAFENNGRYENVICHCAYCDQDTIMNPRAEEVSARSLQCPNCGAALEIRSALDAYLPGPQNYNTGAVRSGERKSILPRILLCIILVFAGLGVLSSFLIRKLESEEFRITETNTDDTSNVDLFGDVIYLTESGGSAYTISEGASDKQLVWDPDADSYYDKNSDCWIWYNTDVDPGIWQYWYEGISSDFGDYGWMEHYEDGWFIEESYDNWIELPAEYDTDDLWYIQGS